MTRKVTAADIRRPRRSLGQAALALALLTTGASAQEPRLEVAFAPGAASAEVPTIAWLCGTLLPGREAWPPGLAIGESFVVRLDAAGLSIVPNTVPLPADALATATVVFGDGRRALGTCRQDGIEDWFVPLAATPGERHLELLATLGYDRLGAAHTLDLAATVGHLLGATAHDVESATLQLAASLCGDVTWMAWATERHLRVRGRSDGGLLLPAVLLSLADARGHGSTASMPLRAYATRDGAREEAIRQMARTEFTNRFALKSMLHSDDEHRLTAIDSLIHLGASEELPRIVSAARPGLPLTTMAASDAVHELWPRASPTTRELTRKALAASPVDDLRALQPPSLPSLPAQSTIERELHRKLQLAFLLLVTGAGLFLFWLRARARAHGYA